MAKYNIYAIAYGIDPVLVEPVSNLKFRTWDDCKPYVIGVEGAKYKGFLTEEEADTWLLQKAESFEKNVTCLNTSEKLEKKKDDKEKHINETSSPIHLEFAELCENLGIPSWAVVLQLKQQFINFHKGVMDLQTKANNKQ